jgi:hypothetical protein
LTGVEAFVGTVHEFYEEVIAHPIPTDFEVVRILSSAPAILDLFVWLSYRCFTAHGKESIPIFGDFGLVQQIGTTEYTRPRRFRQKLDQWLQTIRLLWPECPAKISSDGLYLVSVSKLLFFREREITLLKQKNLSIALGIDFAKIQSFETETI